MSITQQILQATARNWTTTEEADICCHPDFHDAVEVKRWVFMEDSYLSTQTRDKLEAIDDNAYRITWATDLHNEYGEVIVFSTLAQALELFFNHK